MLKALGAQDGCNNGMAQAELALTPPGHDGERCRAAADAGGRGVAGALAARAGGMLA